MPGTEALVQIAIGLALIGAAVWVLRWGWNSRKREGGTAERADALEKAVTSTDAREKRVRREEGLDHARWKKAGRDRRRRRRRG